MLAIQTINKSCLSSDEKDNLKTLIAVNIEIKNLIAEDDQVTDELLRKYLKGVQAGGDGTGFYYSKGNAVYDFWSAVLKPGAVKQTGKKLEFTDGATQWGWTRDVKELYMRKCYTTAVQKLSGVKIAMLAGTPGIGKSLFIFYLLYKMVSEATKKNKSIPTFVIADRDGKGYFLCMDSDGNGIVHKESTETPDFLITDTMGRSNPDFGQQYLHISSINNKNVKDLRKLMNDHASFRMYLPVFSREEYIDLDGDGSNEETLNFYYDVFGGSLRNLRSVDRRQNDEPFSTDIYNVVQAEMTSFFGGAALVGISATTWDKTAKALAKKLENPNEGTTSSALVDPNTISRSIIIHWAPCTKDQLGWTNVPATRFMRHLAGHICDTSNKDALSRLRDAIGLSGEGFVHEHDAHQYRLRHLGNKPGITLWSLQNKTTKTLCMPIARVVRIRTVRDIERLQQGDYGLPTVSHFPLLDAVMKGCLFQDTVAQSHPSVAQVNQILKALKKSKAAGKGLTDLVNTLSTDNFVKMNYRVEMKSFSQWKTSMESRVEDMAAATAQSAVEGRSTGRKRKQDECAEGKQDMQAAEEKPKGKRSKK